MQATYATFPVDDLVCRASWKLHGCDNAPEDRFLVGWGNDCSVIISAWFQQMLLLAANIKKVKVGSSIQMIIVMLSLIREPGIVATKTVNHLTDALPFSAPSIFFSICFFLKE